MNLFSLFFILFIFLVLPLRCCGIRCKFGLALSNGTDRTERDKECSQDTGHYCFVAICANESKWNGSKWLKQWGFVHCTETDEQCAVGTMKIAADIWGEPMNYCFCAIVEEEAHNSNGEEAFPNELPQVSHSMRCSVEMFCCFWMLFVVIMAMRITYF